MEGQALRSSFASAFGWGTFYLSLPLNSLYFFLVGEITSTFLINDSTGLHTDFQAQIGIFTVFAPAGLHSIPQTNITYGTRIHCYNLCIKRG